MIGVVLYSLDTCTRMRSALCGVQLGPANQLGCAFFAVGTGHPHPTPTCPYLADRREGAKYLFNSPCSSQYSFMAADERPRLSKPVTLVSKHLTIHYSLRLFGFNSKQPLSSLVIPAQTTVASWRHRPTGERLRRTDFQFGMTVGSMLERRRRQG